MNKKVILTILVLFFVAGSVVFLLWNKEQSNKTVNVTPVPTKTDQQTQINPIPVLPTPTSTLDTSNWKIYTNQYYKIEFKYPENWFVSSISNGGADFVSSSTMVQFFGYGDLKSMSKSYFYQTSENSSEVLESKNIKNLDELYLYYESLLKEGIYLGLNILGLMEIEGQKVYVLNYFGETQTDYVAVSQNTDGKIIVIDFRPDISQDSRNTILNSLHFLKK